MARLWSELPIAFVVAFVALHGGTALAAEPIGEPFFRAKIEPVLSADCYQCHSAASEKLKGGLRLDTREGLMRGGDSGPVVVPGESGESTLIQALRHDDGLSMPPKKAKLPDSVIADFARWVDAGAPDPRVGAVKDANALGAARKHWAFQPVKPVEVPKVRDAARAENPVDAFVLAKLDEHGWLPAPQATRAEWIRRVSFDLTGLPPTPEAVVAFEQDTSPLAYEKVADRLLEDPHYGERWAQHWLDVIRYAETEGYEYDRPVPGAWRFRDYVIDSLNRDKPFDRFLIEQLAGDEVAPDDPVCQVASAFHRLGPVRRNAGNPEIALSRNEVLTERTDVIGTTFLGLTVGCARCHNHKLEPIAQKDYYRLQAYLAATDEHNISLANPRETAEWETKTRAIKAEIDLLKAKAKKAIGQERERLNEKLDELEDQVPPPLPTIPATRNNSQERTPIHVLRRGEWGSNGESVGPRPLSVLVPDEDVELPADVIDPRTRLARWLASPQHPLTARVFVNRVWQNHFSVGLVKTVNDFGTKGERPSHPELLDWLAGSFLDGGWRLKPVHRLIVLSQTYRQSSRSEASAEQGKTDPENRLLWRFNRRRLSAEEVRDAMLAVSGRLNVKAAGPGVMVPVEPEFVKLLYKPSQWNAGADPTEYDRRSIYLSAKRNLRLPFMETFDAPATLTSCGRRESSTHAPQALELLNGRLSNELAGAFSDRLARETSGDPGRIVDRAFTLALGRQPSPEERALSVEYLREQPVREFALALFNINGFLYVQ
jgi:Protein of unknown function (DUF1553)/Protein of unknown function (DUF1549)/Planctomycete cytochrome C